MYDAKKARQQWQNKINNAQGGLLENGIKQACQAYLDQRRARIEKIPEPFKTLEKMSDGIFKGRFTAAAQPDFQGTLASGRSIVFEAKYTTTDCLKRGVLTEEQMAALEGHHQLGAVAAVCAGIKDKYYFVPWNIWRDMKLHFWHVHATQSDLEPFRVRFTGAVMFLDRIHREQALPWEL